MARLDSSAGLPWLYRYRSSPTFITVTVCVAIFNDVFLFGTIVPILPYALPERIHVGDANIQIYISALLAAYGGALLIGALFFGWLGDKIHKRHALFFCGLCSLLVATLLLAFGRTFSILFIGRALQGMAAAIVWINSLALLTDILGTERSGEAMGYVSIGTSVGTTSAPLLGGFVYSYGGYGAVSLMSISTVGLAFILSIVMIEPIREQPTKTQDGHVDGDTTPVNDRAISTKPSSTASTDSSNEYTPLMPKDSQFKDASTSALVYLLLLKSPRILAAMGGIMTYAFVMLSMEGVIPLFVKTTFGWNSAQASLTFLAWIIPSFLSPIAGKTSDRLGSKWIAVGGLLFAVPPLILLRLVSYDSMTQKVLLCGLLALIGFGFLWISSACLADLQTAGCELKPTQSGATGEQSPSSQSFGLFVVAYSLGGLIGPPVTGVLRTNVSWGTATLILACVCFCISIPIMFFTSSVPRRPKVKDSNHVNDV